MSNPKRHHYLPQFYLNYFCRDGGLWIFDRKRKEFRNQTPKNTALKQHFYTVEDANGQKNTQIEEVLSLVEGQAKFVLERLVSRRSITESDKEELAIFVALMMNRVPGFETSVNEVHEHLIRRMGDVMFADEARVQAIMDEKERESGEKPTVSAKDLVEFYRSGEFDIEVHRNTSLELMLSLSVDQANYFRQMEWGIFHAPPSSAFITTDNPLVLVPPQRREPNPFGAGILTRGSRKVFSLSPKACLIMFDKGDAIFHQDTDKRTVRGINVILATHSDRFVIARDETQLRHVVCASKIERLKPTNRFTIR